MELEKMHAALPALGKYRICVTGSGREYIGRQIGADLVIHAERLETIAKESLEGDEPIFVLVSRVYNIIDPVLNMGIEEHLNAVGCRVIHLEHLQASVMHVEHDYPDLYWPFGQHILTGLKLVKAHKNMYR